MTIPQKLKALRARAGLSQSQLARQLGVSTQTVKHWENGRRGISKRHQLELTRLGDVTVKPKVNNRPKFIDLAPEDWEAASKYSWCELKYDGQYCELRGGPGGWVVTGRRGGELARGPEPLPQCHLLMEHIEGTEWARGSPLRGRYVAWGALSAKGIHLPHPMHASTSIAASIQVARLPILRSFRFPINHAIDNWEGFVINGDYEGLIFRTAGGKFARMKRRVTVDYVCTGADGDSLIGALYNSRGKLIDRVRVPCPDEARPGQVFEASGLRITERGSLRNPRWERWRPDKLARECVR